MPGAELRGYPNGWLEYRAHGRRSRSTAAKVFDGRHRRRRRLERARSAPDHSRRGDQEPLPRHSRRRDSRPSQTSAPRSSRAASPKADYLLAVARARRRRARRAAPATAWRSSARTTPTGHRASRPRAARASSAATRRTRAKSGRARREILTQSRARRVPPAGRRTTTSSPRSRSTRKGRAEGGFETGIQKGVMAILASTKFLYRAEPGAPPAGSAARRRVRRQRSRARVAAVVLPLEPRPRRDAARARGRRHAARARRARARKCGACLRDERSRSLVTNFAFQWLGVRRLDAIDPDPRLYPELRRGPAPRLHQGDGAVSRQHPARRDASVARLADGQPHVRQRAPRAPLRPAERARRSVPPRRARRRAPLRACSARAAC